MCTQNLCCQCHSESLPPSLSESLLPVPLQLLRMEAATHSETRRMLGFLDVAFRLSFLALVAYLVLRWQPIDSSGTMFMCTTHFR